MPRPRTLPMLVLLVGTLAACRDAFPARSSFESAFIFETAPSGAHASTIVDTPEGLLAAWFSGSGDGAPDVTIWSSRHVNGAWTRPIEIASGEQPDGQRYACWNPVLFAARDKRLLLYYKVGPNPRQWWGMVRASRDNGRSWDAPQRLPEGVLGPTKSRPLQLADGTLVVPSSTESPTRPSRWRVHFERSTDAGLTWMATAPPARTGTAAVDAIQPTVLLHRNGRLQALARTRSQRLFETWSSDGGRSWSVLSPTTLPNPDSAVDALALNDGRYLLVYNHSTDQRSPLNVAISSDGVRWAAALVLETGPGEYSYPAVIQSADGRVHITYTWQRRAIKHVAVDPTTLRPVLMLDAKWPDSVR